MTYQFLVVASLAAGSLVAWARNRDDRDAKTTRGRLRWLGWPLALALLTGSAIATLSGTSLNHACLVLIALAVALLLALRPRLAKRVLPVTLILLGLTGFVLVRSYQFHSVGTPGSGATWYGVTQFWRTSITCTGGKCASFFGQASDAGILAQAYLFLVVGGWLAWRSDDPLLAQWQRPLSGLASQPRRTQLSALLLIPAAILTSELLLPAAPLGALPSGWYGSSAGVVAIVLPLAVGLAVLRLWPGAAARATSAWLLCLGLAGVVLALTWRSDYGLIVRPGYLGYVARGVYYGIASTGLIVRGDTPLVLVQAVVLLAAGAWLVPRAFPAVGRLLGVAPNVQLTWQVQRLTASRAVAVDTAASDLRRLERDLHDGAQARLVALGMNLRAAERLIPQNPDAALALVAEARDTSARALTELRELVRGVHPPVLADRGLADAIRALALDSPLHVETDIDLPGRPPAPVETACYFAVAEVLTNAAKHSGARQARIDVRHRDGRLRIEVTDFGLGGADPAAGSGLAGVEKRLAAFDGIMAISSPAGGPTIVALEVPCVLPPDQTATRR